MGVNQPPMTEWLSSLRIINVLIVILALTIIRILVIKWNCRFSRAIVDLADPLIYSIAVVFLIIKPICGQPYFVPTGSMEPTLHGDKTDKDRVWVDKFSYRIWSPKHGDIVVFVPPQEAVLGEMIKNTPGPIHYIKRLIGKPGDVIQVISGYILVNGSRYSHVYVRKALADNGVYGPDADTVSDHQEFMAVHHVKFTENQVLADNMAVPKANLLRALHEPSWASVEYHPGYVMLNGKKLDEPYTSEDPDYDMQIVNGKPLKTYHDSIGHSILYRLDGIAIDPMRYRDLSSRTPEAIPQGMYFMMGDNRNNSADSTEWGCLPKDRIVGRACAIFWPINRITCSL